ncbi:hypothetical protein HDA32_003104 [Spinactinospora alkalitolerans]|uniref:ParB/Sulfiredoxin domain-containing protein n=1 Tax=Spinactinospora alkalitolerans TaxID=687207 RepID=A0A852U1E0_9ACTN|nr:hypothetical protein [Spinactinospora alkalitolerans]NYE47984.1 hypothetical protein [Spinactinospora alkalitolerans]
MLSSNSVLDALSGVHAAHEWGSAPDGVPPTLRGKPFWVDLEQVTTRCAFSYVDDGWHPHWAALAEYQRDNDIDHSGSTLARFFASFVPTTLHEALFSPASTPIAPFDRLPPLPLDFCKRIWELDKDRVDSLLATAPENLTPRGNPHYGPVSADWVRREFGRIVRIYESVRSTGYRPEHVEDGYVHGYFLVRGSRYRFVVLEGNHRLAALKVLGERRVAATLWPSLPLVRYEHLDEVVKQRGLVFSADAARSVFLQLFEETGRRKARDLGMEVLPGAESMVAER